MRAVFVDTGAWYAMVDRRDPNHREVNAALEEHRSHLLTSNFVFDETVTLIRYRLGWQVANQFGENFRLAPVARLERVSPKDEVRAWEIFSGYSDQSFSYTDCTSFALCERLQVSLCAAIDSDFRAFGLHCVPPW